MSALIEVVAGELSLPASGVRAIIDLAAEGATVPFIARYRKEATGGLDEVVIRSVLERHAYRAELDDRRAKILASIEQQGKLDHDLRRRILAADTKGLLEDLYAPFRPKRRTRATTARERGLEPLALRMLAQAEGDPAREARAFVDAKKEVPDVEGALAGARDICAEIIADRPDARERVRSAFAAQGRLEVKKQKKHRSERTKFDDYEGFSGQVAKMPSHRYLALCRGEAEGVLSVKCTIDDERLTRSLATMVGVRSRSPWARELETALADAYRRLLAPRAVDAVRGAAKEAADVEAVEVFAANLRQLLLAPPFGARPVIGIDPGQRTGCKCTPVDATGRVLESETLHLVRGEGALAQARATLLRLCREHRPAAIAVGNGTHGRETLDFVRDVLKEADLGEVIAVSVNEAGASVYSASELAREELPGLDVSLRGAVSIARRLQDPLAELVKIDPKSIGVGQYQHDVAPALLERKLDAVVEDCVHAVGVELDTASTALLARVAGLGPKLADKIVAHREARGRFRGRRGLLEVAGLGPKTFQQIAGFLRVRGGEHPLDASAVHPEQYALVERIAKDAGLRLGDVVGNASAIERIDFQRYEPEAGRFTLEDIAAELKKPGRDPRQAFEAPSFRDDVRTLDDLSEGMVLEGSITNVTAFGAFVDLGVHQDGLVHVSELADRFVRSPSEVVSVGDRVKVLVLGIDKDRRRIALSIKRVR